MQEVATRYQILLDILIILLIIIILHKNFKNNQSTTPFANLVSFVLLILFCVYAYHDTDYFGLQQMYEMGSGAINAHLEEVYLWFSDIAPTYSLFRLAIWGIGLLCFYLSIRVLKLPIGLSLLLFTIISLLKFSYSRVSLGIVMCVLGFVLIVNALQSKKVLNIIWGICLLYLSLIFHRSMIFGVAVAAISLVLYRFKRPSSVLLFASLFGVSLYLLSSFGLNLFLFLFNDFDDQTMLTMERYLSSTDKIGGTGMGMLVRNFITRLPLYMSLITCVLLYIKRDVEQMNKEMRGLVTMSTVFIVVASLFSFNYGGLNTYTLYYRFLNFSYIPVTILLVYCYMNNIKRKIVVPTIWIFGLSSAYTILYSFYCTT